MSIIRYRFKADKNFESVKIDGMSCSLGELKRLIAAKSSRSGSYHPKDDYDLIISNANTHEEYKDNSDLIPRNASVIVARRIRGSVDTLTPFSNQRTAISSDDIVKDIVMPAMLNHNPTVSSTNTLTSTAISSSSNSESNASSTKKPSESGTNAPNKEMTEDELIKEIQMGSHARYVTPQSNYRSNLFVCHNCKQPGHLKNQCPLILQSSNSTNNSNNPSSTSTGAGDGTQSTNAGPGRQGVPHSSHIITRHAPYQMPYHHRGNRSHRGAGHPRGEPLPKKTTGIPRDRLIPVAKHIPGALRDQSGASVLPQEIADLYVSRIGKKADQLAQAARQAEDKGVSSLSSSATPKPMSSELPPNDLLCPLCKQIFTDAVITPCCHFSFCDDCIRTALIDSPEHECPHCHCEHVAIDQINPNLYLRNHIKQWHDRQNQSYSHMSNSQQQTQRLDQDVDASSTNHSNSNDVDEYDPPTVSMNAQPSVSSQKSAPIIIKMQPRGKSQSPQPIVSTRPADMTFEDEKTSDTDQATSSQKDVNTIEEPKETIPAVTMSEVEKFEPETPPAQVAPVNTIYSSPSLATTMAPTNPVVPHYYPVPTHHNPVYSHHIPPAQPNGLYPIQPNYYPPPMGVRYPAPAGIPHYPQYAPAPPIHHHPLPAPPPPIVVPPHIPANGYSMPGFHPHANVPYTSTSTFIAHHQTATQPISTALSENEFYTKQRYFQRMQSPPNRRRSRSSSYSSYSSSDSRSSSRSRYNRRRRSSRSRSRSRRREKSPIRDTRRQRRSSSYRNRRRPIETSDKHSSKYRRSPPRPSREHERRRSPRPPPTIQQSTQRTIVYLQESSHSSRDRRRSKSRSRGHDDRVGASSKKEQPSSESKVKSNSPHTKAPTTLSSKIETVVEDTLDSVQEESSKNGKKHKKHKKHRHSSSKSKKRHRSKDKEKKTIVDTTTSVIEIQS